MKTDLANRKHTLLQSLKKGDKVALKEIMYLLKPFLLAEAKRVLNDHFEAENVVQHVFINLWRIKCNLSNDLDIKVYLRRAVQYESIANVKKTQARYKRQQNHSYHLASSSFHYPVENAELAAQVYQAINRLPPSPCRSFMLMYLGGKSHKEIAAEQKISLQTVKNNISLALRILRTQLRHLLQ